MKKIVVLTLAAHPMAQGGIQTFVRRIKKFYDNDVILLTNKNKDEKIYPINDIIEIGSVNIIFRVINRLLKDKIRKCLVVKELRKINPEIIICNFPYELEMTKDFKCKKKILVQHFNFEKFISDIPRMQKLKEELSNYVVLSPYDKEKFQKGFNIPVEKIKVIRHTCEMELLQNKKEKNKKLIMVARLDNKQKRFDLAIKAMKRLPEFTLDIYADRVDGEQELNMLKKITKENKIDNVFFRGSTIEVQAKLNKAGIFIMTSDFEGYPITLIEAMRRGLPIVLRNTFDSAEDIVIDNGVLLEKEWDEDKFVEAVRKVYDNYEYYSENSKKLGERHSPEAIKKEWDKILGDIVEV
ncbi:glycosyltransferase [uncultured Fusobacterium sp.]|uniref:glycosyltransferase n=1 Tax=uncultured Fusobacterium sp. TaxID=159267 RepID=UPI0025E24E78|nr:glycosyltransferase [uncultured Fusobacterium sp.]